jgi:rhamnosyltransferase
MEMLDRSDIAVIIPTLNASSDWLRFTAPLLEAVRPEQVLVLDSSSTDGTPDLATAAGFRVHSIARSDFNHGGTRQLGADLLPEASILVYLTQDAILAEPGAVAKLVDAFADPKVGAAYGRQLPRPGAGPIEAHARLFNYPPESVLRTFASREKSGVKTIFISNSFAAYRRTALMEAGGFPADVIFGEDTVTAARMLIKGWNIAYVAGACVYHSHDYTLMQEFKRYFDIGVLHAREFWILEMFGRAGGEGRRFLLSELRYILSSQRSLVLLAIIRNGMKLSAYKLGRMERYLSSGVKRKVSMNSAYWVSSEIA